MSRKISFHAKNDLLDPPKEIEFSARASCAELRLKAKKALSLENGYFNEVESYAIYTFREIVSNQNEAKKFFGRFHRTAPTNISDKLQRRQMYTEFCSIDLLDSAYFPEIPKANSMYLITDYGSEKAKVVEFSSVETPPMSKIKKEIELMLIECRPMRSNSNKNSNVHDASRDLLTFSGDEKPDSSSVNDSGKTSEKSTQQNSNHQGKAKTFKRKTKRRGRV